MDYSSVSVIIPTLNEASSIAKVIRETRSTLPGAEIIVVDSSSDGTDSIASTEGARVLRQPKRGYGAALRAGLRGAKGKLVIFMDGDGTYDPNDLTQFIMPLTEEHADLVSGCRFSSKPRNMSNMRYVGNLGLSASFRLLFGQKIKDTQTGMKAAKRETLLKMDLKEDGMPFSTEVLAKAARGCLEIKEVRIGYRERLGFSKLNPAKDGPRIMAYMLKERFLKANPTIF